MGYASAATFNGKSDNPRECLALQAADFLAYEQCKYFADCVKQSRPVEPRMTMRMLKSVPHEYKLMDAYSMGDLLITVVMNDLRQAGEL